MKKTFLTFLFFLSCYFVNAQELTTPQIKEASTINNLTVYFPFNITGVPFGSIRNSYWTKYCGVYVVLYTDYYWKGDHKKHTFKKSRIVNPSAGGAWAMSHLTITPPITKGKTIDSEKTTYYLITYLQEGAKKSKEFYVTIYKDQTRLKEHEIIDKVVTPNVVSTKSKQLVDAKFTLPKETHKKINH